MIFFASDFCAASSRCKWLILLQVAAASSKKSCKWLILLQVAAADCRKSCKWLILLLVAAAGGCCKWPAATGSCKCPNIGGSVQTRSLQVDLLQVPIHRCSRPLAAATSSKINHLQLFTTCSGHLQLFLQLAAVTCCCHLQQIQPLAAMR